MAERAMETGKLLVVDDNEANRDMLSRRLARRGHDVQTAEDGYKALELIGREAFDVILLDIMMPGLNGFEVLEKIRETHEAGALPVIMATALGESDDVVKALKGGANDYVTKPLDFPVVQARVQTQLSLKKARDALNAAHARMKADLDAAARFQRALLPSKAPSSERARFAFRYQPCTELAGDAVNIVQVGDDHICFYLLDVSGHGVPSALLSVTVTRTLTPGSDYASVVTRPSDEPPGYTISTPAEVAASLNDLYPMSDNSDHYFTMAYAVLNLATRKLRIVTAGHPGPLHVPGAGEPRALGQPNLPVGMLPVASFEDSVVELCAGDRVYLFSDGLAEAANAEGEEFGEERIKEAILTAREGRSLDESLDVLIKAGAAWHGSETFEDDLSLVAVEIGE